ncbi:hypothetical protein [Catenovulum sediminis]|uniref:hypothetical protein n=1 Tax=Catenovulum sediminis TaxID=1740262 RepID=UPI00163D8E47|nr:hypothetical protein [Catenovulum sediminis]
MPLSSKQGYLLLKIESASWLEKVQITGPERLAYQPESPKVNVDEYFLLPVKAGVYRVSEIKTGLLSFNTEEVFADIENESVWQFTIESGQINYIGDLYVNTHIAGALKVKNELVNQSSQAYQYIRQYQADLLSRYPMRYAGPGNDPYLKMLTHRQK